MHRTGCLVLALLGCGQATPAKSKLVVDRPYDLVVPRGYDGSRPIPLLIVLHGYGATGFLQSIYFQLGRVADAENFLYAYPDGTLDASGRHFWNATDACCNFGKLPVDDVSYLSAVIEDVAANHRVDRKRIFVAGHSNGGFMSHRLACDLSTRIAGIVSLAGAQWKDPMRCQPSAPIAVLQVHGDADDTVNYEGGNTGPAGAEYPSAHDTVATWARFNGCQSQLEPTGMVLDLDAGVAGAETRVERYRGCRGGAVELWTIQGGGHVPVLQPSFAETIYAFLMAHPKP